MKSILEQAIRTALEMLSIEASDFSVEHPAELAHGDYSTNAAMVAARAAKANPRALAEKLVAELSKQNIAGVEKIEIAGPGFVNFFLSKEFFAGQVAEILAKAENFGRSDAGKGKKVLVEYSSPNIAKPFGVGHLRSTIIGDAIANLFAFSGFEVIRDNHLGDWGTQFGKQIYAIKAWGDEGQIAKSASPVKELVELYVKFHDEAEKNPKLEDEAREWFAKLEHGDPEARRLWKKCIDWSNAEFDRLYARLGVRFDTAKGESEFEEKMKEVVEDIQKAGIARESEGAMLVFFPSATGGTEDRMPPMMILKKDGTTLYATRDLATDKDRKERYGKDLVIVNEVGAEQSLHFKQLFETEEMLGYFLKSQRKHVAHGLFRFKDGKMSTRKGKIIWLDDVLNDAVKRAEEVNSECAEEVGVGAVKFNDLKRSPIQDIVFDWDEILNLKGDSGPYLQYTAVRAKSVVEKAKEAAVSASAETAAGAPTEVEKLLYRFPEEVARARESYAPNILALYLLELAAAFNSFYAQNKIVDTDAGAPYRVALSVAVAQVLETGLTLLGISVPKKM